MKVTRLLTIALCLLCSSVAFAQNAPKAQPSAAARTEASQHFRRGVELFQEEAYRAALVEFQRAYDLAPDYRLLYNIGQAKLQLNDYLGAAQAYDQYLSEGGGAIPPERRTQVEHDLAALKERVGRISIYANMDGAEVFLDEQKIGVTPINSTVLANVGQHRIMARTKEGATDTRLVDVAGGDIAEVALTLIEPVGKTIFVEGKKGLSKRRQAAVITWGAGGALLVGALVTGLMANGSEDDLNKLIHTDSVRPRAVEDKRSEVKALAATTDVLLGVGIASAAAGTLLWFLDKPEAGEKKPETVAPKPAAKVQDVQWGVGVGSVSLRGKF